MHSYKLTTLITLAKQTLVKELHVVYAKKKKNPNEIKIKIKQTNKQTTSTTEHKKFSNKTGFRLSWLS